MGKILGKEYHNNFSKSFGNHNPVTENNRLCVDIISPFQIFSKEEEEKQILSNTTKFFSFFEISWDLDQTIDNLLNQDVIIPQKYLDADTKAQQLKKKYLPSNYKFSLNCLKRKI